MLKLFEGTKEELKDKLEVLKKADQLTVKELIELREK
jgi:hypothetical protein